MMTYSHHIKILPAIFLALLLSTTGTSGQSGTIHWRDGHISRIDSFSEVSLELVYPWWNRHKASEESGKYFRMFEVPELKKINFIRQRGRWSAGFYYRVRISGFDATGERIDEEIPAWDWLDMTIPSNHKHKITTLTFFHQKRRISIRSIEFE